MTSSLRNTVDAARAIQLDINELVGPPEEGRIAGKKGIILPSLVRGTRGYIEKVANQANGAYENGWYDAAAVMIRRLLETLIIECFEANGIRQKIQNQTGDYFYLGDLITKTLAEPVWALSRNAKRSLPKLKDVGDKSAHNRRFLAHRRDLEDLENDIRNVVQELIFIARLK